jgi:signal transduction histidine kinase/Flp pilus assembly protein TadD
MAENKKEETSDIGITSQIVQDTEKIKQLILAAQQNLEKDSKLSIQYAGQAYELASQINDLMGQAHTLLILGKASHYSLDYISSIENLSAAAFIFESISDIENEISALTFTGMSQGALGDFTRALDSLFKALKLSRKNGKNTGEKEILMQIGLVYLSNREIELALEYMSKAFELISASGDKRELASVTGNMGNVYLRLKDFDKAMNCYLECKKIFEELNRTLEIGRAYLNIGVTLATFGKFHEALEYVLKSLPIFTELDRKDLICNTLSTIGSVYYDLKDYKKALEYFYEALAIAEQFSVRNMFESIYGSIADTSAATGDFKTAYEFHLKYHKTVEARMRQTSDVKTKYLNVAYKVDTLTKESEALAEKNTELNQLNEQLILLNKEKNEFLGIAAHDLKNPLASISLSASTIKKYLNSFSTEKIENHLDRIAETSDRMKNIVTNLININAIESGQYNVKKENLNLSALLKHIVDDFRQRASHKDIELVYSETEETKIFTDENAIYSILDNLISNALKYSSAGSYIFIKLIKDDKVTIKIKDNGFGIPDSEKDKVFQKFSRMSNKPTGGEGSTGLGLSIVKKLTELIDGRIYFESEYGKGTTFILELPI